MKNFTFTFYVFILFAFSYGSIKGQEVVDLTGIDNPTILADTLPDVVNGAIILLEPGMVYETGGYAFDKSVTLQSSEPFNLNLPQIDCTSNFNFADGAEIDSIVFKNIELWGEYDARYVLNSDVGATIGELRFDGCYIHDLRGVLRMKDAGPGTLDKFTVVNSYVTRIRDYGLLTVDMANWACNNILIENSTISKTRTFITSKNNTETVVIDGTTLNEVTAAGQRMFRWREGGQNNVTDGIVIKNTIWGPGWDESESGSTGFDGFDGLGETTWTFENVYATSDLVFAEGKDTITGFNFVYDRTAADLWANPAEGNFNFKDADFTGIGNAGDPRWAVATEDDGREWNISTEAFSALGEMDMTKTVAGLSVYAHSGKKVSIDGNEKTLDDMNFTHRLKFGGSGDFDNNGQPLGRVLSIDVEGNTHITVAAMSSSSGEDRVLNIAAGNKDNVFGEFPALGASLTKGVYSYIGGPTKIYFYSPSSGVNVYYIKAASIPTSVREIAGDRSDIKIYPNPATDKVYIDVQQPTQVGIYNISGSLVKQRMINSNTDYVDVSHLKQGMYIIRSLDSNLFVKKLIVK
ncbi:MAG: DUF4957 domain-containing protein [Mariniphaga sp.]|nr:DUF4957 domain-containing protein [Mariniphaga sp.]